MNNNSKAILVLCSYIGAKKQNVVPLQPKEWSDLARKLINKGYQPYHLLDLKEDIICDLQLDIDLVERIKKLVNRSSAISFDIAKYERLGIKCITRADKEYPKLLKNNLGNSCPPIIYYCGDIELLNKNYIGFVGSREIRDEDVNIIHILVDKCLKNKIGVVSGGAKGIDSESTNYCLKNNGFCLEILADSMVKKLKNKDYINYIREKKMLCISFASPEAGFDVGNAMMRNKFIYLFSKGTIVINASYNKGGTWSGAIECIKKGYSPICVVDNDKKGNQELIKLGAKPINDEWEGVFEDVNSVKNISKVNENIDYNYDQLSLF